MRRADRLFQIVQLIRGRRLTTADYLAQRLEVSMRTVYRDIAALAQQGVPIEGEAGVGYRMRDGFDLPPLMFTKQEAQALVATVRMAESRLDAALARQAENALGKILAVLPLDARAAAESLALYAPLPALAYRQRSRRTGCGMPTPRTASTAGRRSTSCSRLSRAPGADWPSGGASSPPAAAWLSPRRRSASSPARRRRRRTLSSSTSSASTTSTAASTPAR